MTVQRTFARSLVTVRTWPFFIDVGVAACALAIFFAIVSTGAILAEQTRPHRCRSRTPSALCRSTPSTPSSASASRTCSA